MYEVDFPAHGPEEFRHTVTILPSKSTTLVEIRRVAITRSYDTISIDDDTCRAKGAAELPPYDTKKLAYRYRLKTLRSPEIIPSSLPDNAISICWWTGRIPLV